MCSRKLVFLYRTKNLWEVPEIKINIFIWDFLGLRFNSNLPLIISEKFKKYSRCLLPTDPVFLRLVLSFRKILFNLSSQIRFLYCGMSKVNTCETKERQVRQVRFLKSLFSTVKFRNYPILNLETILCSPIFKKQREVP